jgi:hypothetical protein
MYGPAVKAHFLKIDARNSMSEGMMASLLGSQYGGSPYLVFCVRRGPELMRDALTSVRAAMHTNCLKKPLKVYSVWRCRGNLRKPPEVPCADVMVVALNLPAHCMGSPSTYVSSPVQAAAVVMLYAHPDAHKGFSPLLGLLWSTLHSPCLQSGYE